MDIAWVVDHDHKRVYVNKKFVTVFENMFTEDIPEIAFFETRHTPATHYYKDVMLRTLDPNYNLINTEYWKVSHPNGLLMWKGDTGATIRGVGSVAIDQEGFVFTAYHVGMIWITRKHTYFNVPLLLKYHTRLVDEVFTPKPNSPSAVWQGLGTFRIEEDITPIGGLDIPQIPFNIPGKLVGLVSGSMYILDNSVTMCTYFYDSTVEKDNAIETIGARTGKDKGKVISLNATATYSFYGGLLSEYNLPLELSQKVVIEESSFGTPYINLFLEVTHNFLVTNMTDHGDSGGGCYLI